jgi:porphobilinogen synthase
MLFPDYRPRRMRRNDALRRMVRETRLQVDDLILPLFAVEGKDVKEPIASLPGQYHLSVDRLVETAGQAFKMGIPAVILFGLPSRKDPLATQAYARDGIVQKAVVAVKSKLPDLVVITDVCLCAYTDHGHCGWWRATPSTTTSPSTCWPARPCPMPRPAPTWWRRPT